MECHWMQESSLDWIFKGPACAVLIINLIFLTSIMWVSVECVNSQGISNNNHTQIGADNQIAVC